MELEIKETTRTGRSQACREANAAGKCNLHCKILHDAECTNNVMVERLIDSLVEE